jgi:signal transduction histidine kinase
MNIKENSLSIALGALILTVLYLISLRNYLLFHGLAEVFSILIAFCIFVLAWNTRRMMQNSYLLFLGIAYLFVGAMDLVHTFAYTGMNVFPGTTTNQPTQLWIAARYMESLSLLIAPLFLGRYPRVRYIFLAYASASLLLIGCIFYWNVFPVCFVEGTGLTPFKKISEYVISLILMGSVVIITRKREHFDSGVLRLLIASIMVTIASELSFTLYAHAYEFFNMVGHYLKIVSFYLIYKAIIETGLRRPYNLLFRELKQQERELLRYRDHLEELVRERTAELAAANEMLRLEIEERKTVEEARRETEVLSTGVLASLHDHVAVIDRDGTIITVNEAWSRSARDNGAKSLAAVSEGANYLEVCRTMAGNDDPHVRKVLAGLEGVLEGSEDSFSMEYPSLSATGELWFLMTVVPLRRPEGGAVVSHSNITGRKQAEMGLRESEEALRKSREEYRAMARKLLSAQEDTRRRLARELHDDFSQRLAVLSMYAAKLEHRRGNPQAIVDGLKRIQDESVKLSSDIHAIARQLHPSILDDLGLTDAVASACERFSQHEGVPVDCIQENVPPGISKDVALSIYRIVQEGLANIAKHARASRILVSLVSSKHVIRLCIKDDGIGFDTEEAAKGGGLGLASMRERVHLIRGKLNIKTKPGGGTEIRVAVPLRTLRTEHLSS